MLCVNRLEYLEARGYDHADAVRVLGCCSLECVEVVDCDENGLPIYPVAQIEFSLVWLSVDKIHWLKAGWPQVAEVEKVILQQ